MDGDVPKCRNMKGLFIGLLKVLCTCTKRVCLMAIATLCLVLLCIIARAAPLGCVVQSCELGQVCQWEVLARHCRPEGRQRPKHFSQPLLSVLYPWQWLCLPGRFCQATLAPKSHGSSHPGVLGALHLLISELLHHPLLSFFALLFPR